MWAFAERAANAGDEDDSDDEHEIVEVEILNHERGEVVGNRHGQEPRHGERGTQNRLVGVS
jgi:hypothetical protein